MGFDYRQLTAEHMNAAMELLGWKQDDLYQASRVSDKTQQKINKKESVSERTLHDIFKALENAGIEFSNGNEPGVKLRKKAQD